MNAALLLFHCMSKLSETHGNQTPVLLDTKQLLCEFLLPVTSHGAFEPLLRWHAKGSLYWRVRRRAYLGDPGGDAGRYNERGRSGFGGACGHARANVAHLGGRVQLVQDDPGVVAAYVCLCLLIQLEPRHLYSDTS